MIGIIIKSRRFDGSDKDVGEEIHVRNFTVNLV
jgi:hypothetical protein